MPIIDILTIVGCVAFTIFVIVYSILNKKKGKTTCGCDCSKCSCCSHSKTQEDK